MLKTRGKITVTAAPGVSEIRGSARGRGGHFDAPAGFYNRVTSKIQMSLLSAPEGEFSHFWGVTKNRESEQKVR